MLCTTCTCTSICTVVSVSLKLKFLPSQPFLQKSVWLHPHHCTSHNNKAVLHMSPCWASVPLLAATYITFELSAGCLALPSHEAFCWKCLGPAFFPFASTGWITSGHHLPGKTKSEIVYQWGAYITLSHPQLL